MTRGTGDSWRGSTGRRSTSAPGHTNGTQRCASRDLTRSRKEQVLFDGSIDTRIDPHLVSVGGDGDVGW